MDLKNRIPCAIMNQGKSMLIDKTSILSQNLGHYQLEKFGKEIGMGAVVCMVRESSPLTRECKLIPAAGL